jgi:CubicO group peptidase (beta-lactamase class C family)
MRRILLLAATILSGALPAQAQDETAALIARIEGPQSPNRQGFDSLSIEQLMQRFKVPGVSIAVIKDFKIHWAKGYGVADVETGRAVDVHTPFQAASISKPVTAMAALRLAQEGEAQHRRGHQHDSQVVEGPGQRPEP